MNSKFMELKFQIKLSSSTEEQGNCRRNEQGNCRMEEPLSSEDEYQPSDNGGNSEDDERDQSGHHEKESVKSQRITVTEPVMEKNLNEDNIQTAEQVYIKTAAEGKRVYDKFNSCFYCSKEVSKIARHLQQVHCDEEEVKKALVYKPNDSNRHKQFERLCRMDNFNHNMTVLEMKKGELKVVRRPSANTDVSLSNYLPCTFCHVFFQKDELWRHAPKCPFQESTAGDKIPSKKMQYEGRFMLSSQKYPGKCSQQLSENVIAIMALDSISLVAQQDKTILKKIGDK